MMESITLVGRLKDVIEDEFKGVINELEQEKAKVNALKEKNEELNRTVKERNDDNCSLVKTLKDLKDKYNRLYDKLKRKQEEINKKEKWWDKYRFTAETTMKKLRTLGTFSPDVLHEVSRDLVDIMEDGSSTESVSSQDGEGKKLSLKKLTTSKDGKKKFRYSEVSPENLVSEKKKTLQQKDPETKLQEQHMKGKSQISDSQRSSCSSSKSKPEIEKNRQKSIPEDVNLNEQDEATSPGCPSLTSTPVLTSAPTNFSLLPLHFPDVSFIPKETTANVVDINKVSKKAETAVADKGKEDRKTTKRNLRILINALDSKGIKERDGRSPSILETLAKTTHTANSLAENNSPSILPIQTEKPQFRSMEMGTVKQASDEKRLSSNAGTNGVKRKRMDDDSRPDHIQVMSNQHPSTALDQGSVVLLSSGDEEDNGKVGSSSVDMFGEAEKSNPKNLTTENEVFEIIDNHNEDHYKNAATSSSTVSSKGKPKVGEEDCSSKYVDEEFPGFRKPDEPTYKNIEVVRKKDDRTKLKGFSCRECAEYYGSLDLNQTELKKRLKHCSRHRAKHSPPPSTPPGFWNLSFPNTQEYMKEGLLKTEEHLPSRNVRRPRRRKLLTKAPTK